MTVHRGQRAVAVTVVLAEWAVEDTVRVLEPGELPRVHDGIVAMP
jgi:hypothetical protein